jgi:hypothetical protein
MNFHARICRETVGLAGSLAQRRKQELTKPAKVPPLLPGCCEIVGCLEWRWVLRRGRAARLDLRTDEHGVHSTKNMKRTFIVFFAALIAVVVVTTPLVSRAAELDAALACGESAHQFIGSLADQQLIDPKPMRVESNSINAFQPVRGERLTAFGFTVFAVVGYEQDDPLFKRGKGEPLAKSAYGAVVFGNTEKVQAAVTEAGSNAIVHHVGPHITAIFCKRK